MRMEFRLANEYANSTSTTCFNKIRTKSRNTWVIVKVEENGSASSIAAQVVNNFPGMFRQISGRSIQKRTVDGGRQETIFFVVSKLSVTNHNPLVALVKEDLQFI